MSFLAPSRLGSRIVIFVCNHLEGLDRHYDDGIGVHTRQERPHLVGVLLAEVVRDMAPSLSQPGDEHVAVEAHLHPRVLGAAG